MRDEEYGPDQIGEYGVRAQPAVAARMRPQLRMSQLGNAVALLAVAAATFGVVRYPDFGADRGYGWALVALVCSVAMLAICSFQHVCWLRGMKEWSGQADVRLVPWMRVSWVVHLVSYLVVLVALWATMTAVVFAGWTATAAVALTLALVLVLAAQVTAAVQYLRESGPPGTLPAHLRRLSRLERRARLGR